MAGKWLLGCVSPLSNFSFIRFVLFRSFLPVRLIVSRRLWLRLRKYLHHCRDTQRLRLIRLLVCRIGECIEAAKEPELL